MESTKTIKSLKLLLAAVLLGSAFSAYAETFQVGGSGLYFTTSDDGTCSVVAPTDGSTYSFVNGDVVIPSSITYNNTNYTVTSIGEKAFYGCTSLTSVTIPESITSIWMDAFKNCSYLTKVNISNIEAWCKIYFDFYTSNPIYYAKNLYLNGTLLTDLVIPESITTIKDYAFINCKSLISITMLGSVDSMGDFTFFDCTNLNKVDITDLEAWCKIDFAYYNYNPLYWAHHLYLNGSLLTNLVIPESITAIKNFTFYCCYDIEYLNLGNKITSIGNDSFYECKSLKGTYTDQFTGEYLNVLIIPNSVTTIGHHAFDNCYSIENIWIGTGCTSIDYEAFYGLGNLKSVTCMAYPAPDLAKQNVFCDDDYANAYLYIYEGDENNAYSDIYNSYADRYNNYWYLFLKGISVGVGEVADEDIAVTTDGMSIEVTGYEGEISVYNVAGMRVYQGTDNRIELTNPGIYVVIVNGKSYKIAIK